MNPKESPTESEQHAANRARRKLSSEFHGKSVKLLPWEVVKAERTGRKGGSTR